jgi:hypothetical protein
MEDNKQMALFKGDMLAFETNTKPETVGLSRTPSTYGECNLELGPLDNEPYIVCDDGCQPDPLGPRYYKVCSAKDKTRSIGWELVTRGGKFYSRIAQYGFEPQEITMTGVGRTDDIPEANLIGTSILFMKLPELTAEEIEDCMSSTDAEITQQTDDHDEVSSCWASQVELEREDL